MYGKNIHRFHPRFEADLGAIMTVGSITAQWQTVNARDRSFDCNFTSTVSLYEIVLFYIDSKISTVILNGERRSSLNEVT